MFPIPELQIFIYWQKIPIKYYWEVFWCGGAINSLILHAALRVAAGKQARGLIRFANWVDVRPQSQLNLFQGEFVSAVFLRLLLQAGKRGREEGSSFQEIFNAEDNSFGLTVFGDEEPPMRLRDWPQMARGDTAPPGGQAERAE